MLKKLIRIRNDIFYSPSHNTFFRLETPEPVDFGDFLLEISGHEEKIFEFLICHYNNYVTKEALEQEFPECSDPYDKTLDRLRREKLEAKLKLYGLIKKAHGRAILYLSESPFSVQGAPTPRPLLLGSAQYYVNYDRILADFAPEAEEPGAALLQKWLDECAARTRFDERCLMLLERMGFLPAFGKMEDKRRFLSRAKELVYRFDEEDVTVYGGTELLLFSRSVMLCVIEYIQSQLQIIIPDYGTADLRRQFAHLLRRFETCTVPEGTVNPLLLTVFHDYYGLVLYRNYLFTGTRTLLERAAQETSLALSHARQVDLHLQVWAAFLTYNQARILSALGEHEEALRHIRTAVILREGLVDSPFFGPHRRHDLYFEYLLARIVQTDVELCAGVLTPEAAREEYALIADEADAAYDSRDPGDTQGYILRLLEVRGKKLES